ncbi:MAG: hypothetical protein ACLGIB_08105 [Actinomycetota bacterium]
MEEERAARYSDLFANKHEHSADNCAYCPICATIGVLRNTKPEVLEHLAKAAKELVAVAGLLLEEAGEVVGAAEAAASAAAAKEASNGGAKVRRIDIS